MRPVAAWLATVALALVMLADAAAGSQAGAGLGAEQIWTANVFGTESSPSDGIIDGRGWVRWSPDPHARLGLSGRLVRFLENSTLDHGYLNGSLEGLWMTAGKRQRYTAGVLGTWRLNRDLYAVYDYREIAGYVSLKRHVSLPFSVEIRADVSARAYPDWPKEDANKAWLSGHLNRSFPTRTSVGLTARAGWKRFLADRADSTGATIEASPRAALWDVALRAAQSLSERLAVRGWWGISQLYDSVDATAQLAVFENPLLDEFSYDGPRYGAGLKAILPAGWIVDLQAERAERTYPGRPPLYYDPLRDQFVLDNGERPTLAPGERRDSATRIRLDADKRIDAGGGGQLSLRAGVEWVEQESNDLYWVWDGWTVNAGASLAF